MVARERNPTFDEEMAAGGSMDRGNMCSPIGELATRRAHVTHPAFEHVRISTSCLRCQSVEVSSFNPLNRSVSYDNYYSMRDGFGSIK